MYNWCKKGEFEKDTKTQNVQTINHNESRNQFNLDIRQLLEIEMAVTIFFLFFPLLPLKSRIWLLNITVCMFTVNLDASNSRKFSLYGVCTTSGSKILLCHMPFLSGSSLLLQYKSELLPFMFRKHKPSMHPTCKLAI